MERLNEILKELGISKVKLAKCLGVSRQMIYNYLELDSINKWPKDKKVILLNILGVKSAEEINDIKVDTDYIKEVESRMNNLFTDNNPVNYDSDSLYDGMDNKRKQLLSNIISEIKEYLSDEKDMDEYNMIKYLYEFIQHLNSNREERYILAYYSKYQGKTNPNEFVFNDVEQFVFEGVLFSALNLYHAGNYSKDKIASAHKRFVDKINEKREEDNSRTEDLSRIRQKAMDELGITEVNNSNLSEFIAKFDEIESRYRR